MKLRLREIRELKMLSQGELAALADVSRTQINRIENGHVEPRMATVRKLVQALDVAPAELIVRD